MFSRALAPYCVRFPEKVEAKRIVAEAIRRGELVRGPCEVCGEAKSHGHHPDYDKPLGVMWLCAPHHLEWHERNGPGLNGGDPDDLGRSPTRAQLTGQRFGFLRVVAEHPERDSRGAILWACQCDCGNSVRRATSALRRNTRASCNPCAYAATRARFFRNSERYTEAYREGLGIYSTGVIDAMTDEIREDIARALGFEPLTPIGSDVTFSCFTGSGAGSAVTVDIMDSFELRAPRTRQVANQARRLSFDGQNLTIRDWALKLGISTTAISQRLRKGWPLERVLSQGDARTVMHRKAA